MTYYCEDCSFAATDDDDIDDHEEILGHTMVDQYADWDSAGEDY